MNRLLAKTGIALNFHEVSVLNCMPFSLPMRMIVVVEIRLPTVMTFSPSIIAIFCNLNKSAAHGSQANSSSLH